MFRFIHTADWQLGASSHPSIYSKALPKLVDIAKEKNIKNILTVGDIFDKPHPDQITKDYLLKIVVDNPNINWYFTIGNHDYTSKSKEYHSLIYFKILHKNVNNVYICEKGEYDFDEFHLSVLDSLEDIEYIATDKPLILAWHGMLPSYSFQSCNKLSLPKTIESINYDYFALGDVHKRLKINNRCFYPGALVQKTYDCEDGIVLVEIDKRNINTEILQLDLPKRITLNIDFEEGKDSEDSVIDLVKEETPKDSLLRIKFNLPLPIWSCINKQYTKEKLRNCFTSVKMQNDPIYTESKNRANFDEMKKVKTIDEELDILLKEDDYGLDSKKLKKICKKYIQC